MIRLCPISVYESVRARARRFTLESILPQHDSIPGALIISTRQIKALSWSAWIVDPLDDRPAWKRWWKPRPTLPTWQPDLSGERTIVFNNAGVQRGLAVQGAFLQADRYRFDRFAGLEIVAYSVARDLCRVWYVDWQRPLEPGVDPRTIKPGQSSSPFTPRVDETLKQHALSLQAHFQATAGKRCLITKEKIEWSK
jgi:hypothetical protein